MSLADFLSSHADSPLLLEPEKTWSYRDFTKEISALSGTVRDLKGAVLLEGDHSFSAYSRFAACMEKGLCAIPASKEGFESADFRRELISSTNVPIHPWALGQSSPSPALNPCTADVPSKRASFVIRTSGTSGVAHKLVLHDFDLFLAKHQAFGRHFNITSAFSPFDSIAGIETFSEVIANGASLARLPPSLNPAQVCDTLLKMHVDYFQTTPSYLLLMLASQTSLPDLKKIAFGSEPTPLGLAHALRKRFPGVELNQTYGMTEIGILRTLCPEDNCSLFLPDPDWNPHRIVDGFLEVKSPTRMICYLNHPDPECPDGWFPTNDIVHTEGKYLRVQGRRGDLIAIGGRKFLPAELESLISECPNVRDSLVKGEAGGLMGTRITAKVVLQGPEEEARFRERFKAFSEKNIPPYMRPHSVEIVDEIQTGGRFKKIRK